MRHAVPFAQLLDEAVAAATVASSRPGSTPSTAFPRAVGFFEFTVGAQPVPRIVPHTPSTYQIVAEPGVNAQLPNANSQTFVSWKWERGSLRAEKRLTPAQRKAVDELRSLGASLDADFSAHELRGAYRQLARRYHPDLHPTSTEREKARLSALFTRAHASYQTLLGRDAA
jgi:hypothetical protein